MGGRPTTRPRSALREEVPLLMANDLRGDSAPDMHRHRRLIWMLLSPICTPWAPRTSTWYSRPGNRGCSASGADTALRDTAVPPVPTGAVPMPELSATAAGNEGGLNGFARPASARLTGSCRRWRALGSGTPTRSIPTISIPRAADHSVQRCGLHEKPLGNSGWLAALSGGCHRARRAASLSHSGPAGSSSSPRLQVGPNVALTARPGRPFCLARGLPTLACPAS